MLAARWPDDIRGDKAFDHPMWHYIDYPYKPPGQPASVSGRLRTRRILSRRFSGTSRWCRAQRRTPEGRGAVLDLPSHGRFAPAPARVIICSRPSSLTAIAAEICFSSEPDPSRPETQNLHAYWDNILSDGRPLRSGSRLAANGSRSRSTRDGHSRKLGRIAFRKMDHESFDLAVSAVYRKGKLKSRRRQESRDSSASRLSRRRANELPSAGWRSRRPAGGFPADQFP